MNKYVYIRQMCQADYDLGLLRNKKQSVNFDQFVKAYTPYEFGGLSAITSDHVPPYCYGSMYMEDEQGNMQLVSNQVCSSDGGGITRTKNWGNG